MGYRVPGNFAAYDRGLIHLASFSPQENVLRDYPKEIILKNGTGITLRPLRIGDGHLLRNMYERLPESDRWFLSNDMSHMDLAGTWMKDRESKKALSVVAVLDGEIIANATLITAFYGARSHIGEINVLVDPHFRRRYLGTWMILDLINLAMTVGLEILVIMLVEGRDAYIVESLKKLDFSREADLKDYVKDRDGSLLDLVILIKRLKHALPLTQRLSPQ